MEKRNKKQLQAEGFKKIPYCVGVWLKADGTAYNANTKRISKPRTITTQGKEWQTEKVILWLFKGIAPRSGQITHIDGNARHKQPENLQYSSICGLLPKETVNNENLRTALRCYISIDNKAKPRINDFIIKSNLRFIYQKRDFDTRHNKKPFFNVFRAWISETPKEPKQPENLTPRERNTIIAHFLNLFTSEICKEYEAGALELQPYHQTKREKRKNETKLLHEFGIKRQRTDNKLNIFEQWKK